MRKPDTAIVYVVSPDREDQLFRSLESLLSSGSKFDFIRICCVGSQPELWEFADPRISVESVEPLFGGYFFGNKLHLCDTSTERVIFLDADTLILRSLDALWRDRGEEFLARRGSAMSVPQWNHTIWHSLFADMGAAEIPMFNAGLLLFQRGSHRRLKQSWRAALLRFLAGELPCPWRDKRMFEQWSLAMAVAQEKISFAELGREDHAFGWCNENPAGAVVFHYGNQHFRRLAPHFALSPPLRKLLRS